MDENYINRYLSAASEISIYQLVNVLSDAAFICDHSGRILICSDQVLSFFSLSDKTKVIGSSLQSYFAYEHIDEAYSLLLSVVNETNSRNTGKFQVRRGQKETFSANVTIASIVSGNIPAKYFLVTFRESPLTDAGSELLLKKGIRLSRLSDALFGPADKPEDRTRKLLSQIGETLGSSACTYSRFENGILIPFVSWESPFNNLISPQVCSKQLFDYLTDQHEQMVLIRKPLLTTFLESEAQYNQESGVKAIFGLVIKNNAEVEGILTSVFTFNYSLSDIDIEFIQTISALIKNEVRQYDQAFTEPEFSFTELIDCFIGPVFVMSSEGIFMEVNKGTVKYFGYEREELIGQSSKLFSAEDKNDKDLFQHMFEKSFSGETQKFEWWSKTKSGDIFPLEVIFNKSKYYNHDVVIAVGRDLTESKKAEDELLHYNTELEESNASKDKFFGILAHDLKNPFQGLLGFIDLLYEDLDELSNTQIKEYLSNVRNASYHTYALLENLLEWSRIQSGKMPFTPSVFNIRDEINSVISVLDNNAIRKEIQLINEVDQEIMVEADRNMIHSVLQNLITNSIKFSNSKSKVVVRSRVPQTNKKAKNDTEPGERLWLEISIADNGIGIPEEILPRLFKLNGQYSQAGTANEPGTGLGLVLCHEMVEKNGGRIWAESIAGQGTTFIFTLPLSI